MGITKISNNTIDYEFIYQPTPRKNFFIEQEIHNLINILNKYFT